MIWHITYNICNIIFLYDMWHCVYYMLYYILCMHIICYIIYCIHYIIYYICVLYIYYNWKQKLQLQPWISLWESIILCSPWDMPADPSPPSFFLILIIFCGPAFVILRIFFLPVSNFLPLNFLLFYPEKSHG